MLGLRRNVGLTMERQKHGFSFQSKILEIENSIDRSYTDAWDMVINDELFSIKCIKEKSSVELGSLLRFYKNTNPFTFIVGWHNCKHITSVQVVKVDLQVLNSLKADFSIEEIEEITDSLTIKTFPTGYHKQARQYFKNWKVKNKHRFNMLTFTGKVDSKNQRRWQCNINYSNWTRLFGIANSRYYNNFNFSGFSI